MEFNGKLKYCHFHRNDEIKFFFFSFSVLGRPKNFGAL